MRKGRLPLLILPLIMGALYLRSLASWRPQKVFVGVGQISQLVFSSDGNTLFVGQYGVRRLPARLTALDAANGFGIKWANLQSGSRTQLFASGTRILNVGRSMWNSIQTLDSDTGRMLSKREFGKDAVVSPDGKWLASHTLSPDLRGIITLGQQQDVIVEPFLHSDLQPGKARARRVIGQKHRFCDGAAFSPDGKSFVVGEVELMSGDTHLDFYDTKSWKRTRVWSDFKPSPVIELDTDVESENVQWSRDGRLLLSSSNRYLFFPHPPSIQTGVSLWRVRDGKRLASTVFESSAPSESPAFYALSFALQNDGRVLALSADGRVFLDAIATLSLHSRPLISLPTEKMTAFALSPDGFSVVVGTQSGRVYWQRLK